MLQAAADLGLEENVDYQTVEASPGTPGREEVVRLGGKAMVPFLVDGQTSMYESQDIIRYMQEKFA